jgi:hypothetical protein
MNDLDKFLIERATAEDKNTFERVATVQLEDRFRFKRERRLDWLDNNVQPGKCYVYRMTAVTLDGSHSVTSAPAPACFGGKDKGGK